MQKVVFDEAKCKGCELCMQFCPKGAIRMAEHINAKGYHPAVLADEEKCISCAICARMCPDAVIEVFKP
ncbi:MAG: 4Fe-4S binding protein [Clostridia bacterium]|nr:4Fe-4S binding protein [Clostridia bacterium]